MSWAQIEPRERALLEAFNAGDAAGVARHYAQNARVLPPNADIVEGRAAIEAFFAVLIEMGATLGLRMIGMHESPDLCAEVGYYELSFTPPGGGPITDAGKGLIVWTRDPDGSWLIAEDMFSSSLPAPGS
jgi:ketosteroid isomerase-like protein